MSHIISTVILQLMSLCWYKPWCLVVAGSSTSISWVCSAARPRGRTKVGSVERITSWICHLLAVSSTPTAH